MTHILGKSKLLIPAFKIGRLTDLVAVFESHCSLCTCRAVSEKWPMDFCWSYAIYRTDLMSILFWHPSSVDGTKEFSHGYDSRIIWIKILMSEHHIHFETTAFSFIHMVFLLISEKCPNDSFYIHLNLLKVDCLFVKLLTNDSWNLYT